MTEKNDSREGLTLGANLSFHYTPLVTCYDNVMSPFFLKLSQYSLDYFNNPTKNRFSAHFGAKMEIFETKIFTFPALEDRKFLILSF